MSPFSQSGLRQATGLSLQYSNKVKTTRWVVCISKF